MCNIANNVLNLVNTKGITAYRLGQAIGVDHANLSKMLRGKLTITKKTIDKICAAFPDVNRDWLLSGKGEMFLPAEKQINMHMSESPNSVQIAHGGAEKINIKNKKTERKMEDSTEFYQRLVERLMGTIEAQTASYARLSEDMKRLEDKIDRQSIQLEQQSAKMREMESALGCRSPRTDTAGQEVKNVG